ncbi:MAG TPA: DUF58 domain-containing protein [Gemmatimonadales bacterium]|nr:DUF58 domain-containing protein [Gemmatimonadales bacterium]
MIPAELVRVVRQLEITTRGLVRSLAAGDYASVFRGRGVEFAEVREYMAGDDIRTIDWNVTARLGVPYVKRFREERQLTVLLVIDVSASGHFGSALRTKRDLAAELAAVLALAGTRHRDRVGAVLYTDRIEWFAPPRSGRRHALTIVDRVLGVEPAGRGTNLPLALDYLEPLLRRRAAVVVISDFMDPDQWSAIERLAPRHDVVAIQLSDPRERALPSIGLANLWDPETGDWKTVDLSLEATRRQLHNRWAEFEASLARRCHANRIDLLRLSTDRPYSEPLAAFFGRRDRRTA